MTATTTPTTPGGRGRRGVRRPQAPTPTWASGLPSFQDLLGGAAPAPGTSRAPGSPWIHVEPVHEPEAEPPAEQAFEAEPGAAPEPFVAGHFAAAEQAYGVYEPESLYEPEPAYEPEQAYEPAPVHEPEALHQPGPVHEPEPAAPEEPALPALPAQPALPDALSWLDPGGATPPAKAPGRDKAGRERGKPAPTLEKPAQTRANPAPRTRRRLAVPRLLDSRRILVAVTVVALVAGVGAGAVVRIFGSHGGAAAATTPEQCAVAQVAWAESASQQVAMVADKPGTLRSGFMGARKALDTVAPPPGVSDDWKTVTHYVDTVAKAVEPVKATDGAAITAAVGKAINGLDTKAATAASARVTTYLKAGCKG
ncbi:MAG: hypothetical protein FWF90_13545 [Promicromonosporaceae bacterium]|nr:hypothetical protein [Promicromonosporaceae bacterium]